MSTWLWILIIVLLVPLLFGGVGWARGTGERRGRAHLHLHKELSERKGQPKRRPFCFQSLLTYLGVVRPRHRSEVERLVEHVVADAGVARDIA